jgi:hypothetical protein
MTIAGSAGHSRVDFTMQAVFLSPLTDIPGDDDAMSESQARDLGPSPETFVQDISRTEPSAQIVWLSEDRYREASFLDGRVISPETPTWPAPWADVEAASAALPQSPGPDYIFHLGHAGSTLVSRILGDHPEVHALREPPWLRTLAEAAVADPKRALWPDHPVHRLVPPLSRLAARTFRPGQRAMVKATSFASELAPHLLAASPGARAVALVTAPQIHMATLFAGQNNAQEVNALGPSRLIRLKRRAPELLDDWSMLSEGQRCAATWLSEMASIAAALNAAGPSGMAVDFDQFLNNPKSALSEILTHFRLETSPSGLEALAASPHFSRYSKAQSYQYSPNLRRQVLTEAWNTHSAEIKKGLDWLKQSIDRSPGLAALLSPFWRG